MATQIIDKNSNITSLQNVSYIRGMDIDFSALGCKPNTRVFPFFDGQRIDEYITPLNGSLGDVIITDSTGTVSGVFSIPGFTFTTGSKNFVLSESPATDEFSISNNTYTSQFKTTGTNSLFVKTNSDTNNVTATNVSRIVLEQTPKIADDSADPIAQSFNTYGITGGCFLSHIDLFFSSKDTSEVPVSVEIRTLVNGYPSNSLVSIEAKTVLYPSSVNIASSGGTQYTRFSFPKFVYLAENQEYCFVVNSNSSKYNLYAAAISGTSLENGATVFEQPYSGSMFKSQNNSTWVPDSFTNLKFAIGIAQFDTSVAGTLDIVGTSPSVAVSSKTFSTTNASATIRANLPFKHALGTGYKINVAVDTNGTYNGIPGISLNGTWDITSVIDPYTVDFNVGAVATSTGKITHGGTVQEIYVTDTGSGYTTPPTITFSDPTTPSNRATGTAIIRDGKLMRIDFNSTGINSGKGIGYVTAPTITITPNGSGSGAAATAYLDQNFGVTTNRFINNINPAISNFIPSGSTLTMNSAVTLPTIVGDAVTSQQYGADKQLSINSENNIENTAIILSPQNEAAKFSGNKSSTYTLRMSTANKNVSPVIDVNSLRMMHSTNLINNQNSEIESGITNTELASTHGTGAARDITFTNTLSTVSTSATVYVTAYSSFNTSFEVYIRTSLSANNVVHTDQPFVLLTCDEERHKSTTKNQFFEYKFYSQDLPEFDVYDLKIVLRSKELHDVPAIANYRAILTA